MDIHLYIKHSLHMNVGGASFSVHTTLFKLFGHYSKYQTMSCSCKTFQLMYFRTIQPKLFHVKVKESKL